jgi:VTC domain
LNNNALQGEMPQQLERYELKFTIPFEQIEPISLFAAAYCSLDRYSVAAESGFYSVHNLYLDSPSFLFLRNRRERVPNRFNMRVRSYGDAELPYFLEIKQKLGGVIRKYRAPVHSPDWHCAWSEPGCSAAEEGHSPEQAQNRDLFERLVYSYQVEPKILTQYARKAWVSEIDDYARVTFDTDLRYCERSRWDPTPDEDGAMQHYDLPAVFDPGCSVVLELKCYASAVPLWMVDLIHTFSLKRRAFSKYMFGIYELTAQRGYDPALRVAMAGQ